MPRAGAARDLQRADRAAVCWGAAAAAAGSLIRSSTGVARNVGVVGQRRQLATDPTDSTR